MLAELSINVQLYRWFQAKSLFSYGR